MSNLSFMLAHVFQLNMKTPKVFKDKEKLFALREFIATNTNVRCFRKKERETRERPK